jgi:hypothetical protein
LKLAVDQGDANGHLDFAISLSAEAVVAANKRQAPHDVKRAADEGSAFWAGAV